MSLRLRPQFELGALPPSRPAPQRSARVRRRTVWCILSAASLVSNGLAGADAREDEPRAGQRLATLPAESCAVGLAGAVPLASRPVLRTFPLDAVEIRDASLLRARELDRKYLHSLEPDRLLWAFRRQSGLPTPGEPLGGWEVPTSEVRGHFVGHWLTATALMFRSTGDEALRARAARVVDGLAECQAANGGGYLSAFPPSLFDRLESRTNLPWAPYYTMHKILAGLLDQYRLAGNAKALEVARGMAGYFSRRLERFDEEELRSILAVTEEGGICESLWNLHALTGDPAPRDLAIRMEKRGFLDPLSRGEDVLTGRHGNTHIPLVVGAARRHEITGDERYRGICELFWDRVVLDRTFATGGSTNGEMWGEPRKLASTLSNTNHETCKTYNMLRLTRHLLAWSGDARYGDFLERAFTNGILGTQEPATGMLEYYVPQASGHKRVFGTPFTTFWCCYGTGIESFAKLQDSVYFEEAGGDGVRVNLFVSSRLSWQAGGLEIVQEAGLPDDGRVELTVRTAAPSRFALSVRIPAWIAAAPEIVVAGEAVPPAEVAERARPGSWFRAERVWQDGDRLQLRLPMGLRAWPMPDDPGLVAILRGPAVLAGIIDGGDGDAPLFSENAAEPQPIVDLLPRAYFVASSPDDLSWLERVPGRSGAWRSKGQPFQVTFVPFQSIVGERYGLWWPIVPPDGERRAALDAENRALSFLRRARDLGAGGATGAGDALDAEIEEHRTLASDPALLAYRERLDLALAGVLAGAGRKAEAAKLLEPHAVPFVRRDLAPRIEAILGAPPPALADVKPLLVAVEAWDGSHLRDMRGERPAIATDLGRRKGHIYFSLPPSSPLRGAGKDVTVELEYFSEGVAGRRFLVEYDAAASGSSSGSAADGNAYAASEPVEVPATPGWHRARILCPAAAFSGRQNAGSDLRLNALGTGDLWVADLRISADPAWAARVFGAFERTEKDALDLVLPGDAANEAAHALDAGSGASGRHLGRGWRDAPDRFGWRLAVPGEDPAALACVYWGSDVGRTFDVLAEGTVIATQSLEGKQPGVFFVVEYPIPRELTRGKPSVEVRFVARSGLAGGVFACATRRAGKP